MRYESKEKRILISVKEFVSLARRGISTTLPYDDEEPSICDAGSGAKIGLNGGERVELEYTEGGINYCLFGKADEIDRERITLVRELDGKPRRADLAQARAEAFVLGYMLAAEKGKESILLRCIYINTRDGDSEEKEERVTLSNLQRFFDKCKIAVGIYGKPEVERVTERLPSMKAASFPYREIREGQNEFIRSAYRALMRGTRLYATAPTGTGKTVSALFPALRALGDGKLDKVFYLTPKTTTVNVAVDCLNDFAERGVRLRAIAIGSKERSCKNGHKCRDDRRLCESSGSARLADAVMELYRMGQAVITPKEVGEVAPKYTVCPYELGLAYSELCDIVICDFNYLFDPSVYIRRYFTEGGSYAFLVDEAHNLAERAREMYTAELELEELQMLSLSPELINTRLKDALAGAAEELKELLYPYLADEVRQDKNGVKVGATHLNDIPNSMYSLMGELYDIAQRELLISGGGTDKAKIKLLKGLTQRLKKVNNCLQVFDDRFRLILFLEGDNIRIKWYCLDTGGVISSRLDKGASAVLFSATLSPLSYYRDILGGDSTSE
ncbi:MAG: DEAD/DEAH box helicase family protein, partial [Clostridia bacterium]|nr:DEAD/DEAH box helicase family protein [Clostridia bacterium]